ncbi:SPASM domain-containing protein [Cesiribacter sp. SM1]|uniref:SPASM domain-containing protein n=1 Tax=Cesiribacter sp. SM1 TaxID=2861196 RepID=UPI001CD205D1|nr:SPASM domain-containing protein [Cesiribacter sp. SM1]
MSALLDGYNFSRTLTPRKLRNAAQVLGSYYYSRTSGRAGISGMPLSISFEPTTHCNLRCPECPSGLRSFSRPTGMLQHEVYQKVIDELQDTLLYLLLYFQGEPYLHPQFLDLVQYAHQRGIYTATSTNAHYLSDERARQTVESGLSRLIISLDGTTQEVYEQYRVGGKLEKVLEGTKRLLQWRKQLKSRTPYVVFQFLVVRPNEHQLEDAKKLAKQLGVDDVWFKTAQIYDYEEGSPLIPTIGRYSRYQQGIDGRWHIKNKLLDHCWKMWHSCVVTWDGKVVPCCFDKDAHHRLGDAQQKSFREIWNSGEYEQFRSLILKGRDQIEMCRNCTEGTKVWG